LDDVFEQARAEILKSKSYKNFIKTLIAKHCICDACIVISKRDEKTLTAAFVNTCATNCKRKFTRRVTDTFEGGIIIESEKYDIRLTLDDIFANAREQIEKQVAELLWG
jgi:vacuolar-type H+-ATPase subunit E/Vma4